jgi:hypothetical protein
MRRRSKPSSVFWRNTRRVEGSAAVCAAAHALVRTSGKIDLPLTRCDDAAVHLADIAPKPDSVPWRVFTR